MKNSKDFLELAVAWEAERKISNVSFVSILITGMGVTVFYLKQRNKIFDD